MAKHVVVIASGETERRALPHLTAHLMADGVIVDDVRIPPRNRLLNVEMAERLLKAAWFQASPRPDKFVILVDTDGKSADEVLRPMRNGLPARLGQKISASIQFAVAQWHLEAWYFADSLNLRNYLGRAPGVDISKPDEIRNPKQHLKHLLGQRVYTAVVSEEIARLLQATTIAQRSPSFQDFLAAVRNGTPAASRETT